MPTPELSWLPSPRADWKARLRDIDGPADLAAWQFLAALANFRLDQLATIRLDRRLQSLFGDEPPPSIATRPVRLAVLASSTVDHLLPALRVAALRRNIWLHIHSGDFGLHSQDLVDTSSDLHDYKPDTVLFAMDSHHLFGAAGTEFEKATYRLVSHWRLARRAFDAHIVQQTLLPVFPRLFGNNEHRLATSGAALVERFNTKLREIADAEGVDLLAIDARAAQDGIAAWYDQMSWHRTKQEVHPGAATIYADLLSRMLAARQGHSAKCLVFALDNTIWGGVTGGDAIQLGQGSAIGEAFVAVQSHAHSLARRGVILAVCSKNDERTALELFKNHPDMVLRRDDVACFLANGTDKATNLRAIAKRLNVGLESLVFVDGDPSERAVIRHELPTVSVPELPEDPGLFARTIADAGYFEAIALPEEKRHNLGRKLSRSETRDLEDYPRGLEMKLH